MTGTASTANHFGVNRSGEGESTGPAAQESEPKRVCGTLGQVGQRGMPLEADPVWGAFT